MFIDQICFKYESFRTFNAKYDVPIYVNTDSFLVLFLNVIFFCLM